MGFWTGFLLGHVVMFAVLWQAGKVTMAAKERREFNSTVQRVGELVGLVTACGKCLGVVLAYLQYESSPRNPRAAMMRRHLLTTVRSLVQILRRKRFPVSVGFGEDS